MRESVPSSRKVLVLAASPENLTRIRVDKEVREIEDGLRRARYRERFELEHRPAARPRDLQQAMLDFTPQIVHFCGHGSGSDGLILEDDNGMSRPVPILALSDLFQLFADQIECVVLNSCHSAAQAGAIVKHVPYVIGMRKEIDDSAAINFAIGFYCALGAGRPIDFAYRMGCNAIAIESLPGHLTPVLLSGTNVTARLPRRRLTPYSVLSRLSRIEIQTLLEKELDLIAKDEEFLDAHLELGLVFLHLKMHDDALRHFSRALEIDRSSALAHFYFGLASIRGRRPKTLSLPEVRGIEEHLSAAMYLDSNPAHFPYMSAIIKHDYYSNNGLSVPPPTISDLLQLAANREYDQWEIERALDSVTFRDQTFLSLIRRPN
jgi:tetratricopeptide (TPR) repeat protein